MKNNVSLFLLIAVMAIGLMAFNSFESDTSTYYEPQPTWKNLKVLPQNISKDSLFGLMDNYSLSLGVKCSHCHVPQKKDPTKLDFASDEKIEKHIARGMITMTNEINENYFKPHFPDPKPAQVYVADCVMCHRGNPNPKAYLSNMEKMYHQYMPATKQ